MVDPSRWKQPSAANNLRRLLPAEARVTAGRLRPSFESWSQAEDERELRLRRARSALRRLENGPRCFVEAMHQIGAISLLIESLATADAPSLANPTYFRELRRRLSGELLRLLGLEDPEQVSFYHLAAPSWALPVDDLFGFSPRRLRERLRTNLIRSGRLDQLDEWCAVFFTTRTILRLIFTSRTSMLSRSATSIRRSRLSEILSCSRAAKTK